MRRCLCAVDEHRHSVGVGVIRHLFHRIDSAQYVADVAERCKNGSFVEIASVLLYVELSGSVYVHHPQFYVMPCLEKLPRHNVGMMLHDGQYHLVAVVEERSAV